ncbi:MAG: DUF1552 domain-containing protein [Bradymonadaceae bacterium]|nr:DUF1552 domain-containing protein [Lujinxingiaceae bacterium]
MQRLRNFKMSRRSVLKGIAGAALGLPMLDVMLNGHGEAFADTHHNSSGLPQRFLVCFGGQSLGCDGDRVHNMYVPERVGADYDLKTALVPLGLYNNIKDEVTVVSGLRIATANGGAIPSGGRSDDFHISSLSPLFSGVRSGAGSTVQGITSDQIVADQIADGTTFRSLNYRAQASWYLTVSAPYGRDLMSYRQDGNRVVAQPGTVSPRLAYNSLFSNFSSPDPSELDRRNFLLAGRKSVIDLVRQSYEELIPQLGAADRHRLNQHLHEIRDLERRIQAIPPAQIGACAQTEDPGEDPAIGGNQTVVSGNDFDTSAGYSSEDDRARIFCDLIYMAFACDMTRVGTLMFTMAQSHMSAYPFLGESFDIHEVGHSRLGTKGVSDVIAWHMKHFAYLLAKMRDTNEGSGNMLDNSAVVFLHEGGHGLDPATGNQYSSHSTENMACLIAGRAGGLAPGRHVVAEGKHPANVLISAMNAVGVQTDTLGEVSGAIPGLFGA